jgi:hypothetical protein
MSATASRVVELEAARAPALGHERGGEDQQLVLLSRGVSSIRCPDARGHGLAPATTGRSNDQTP